MSSGIVQSIVEERPVDSTCLQCPGDMERPWPLASELPVNDMV